MLVVMVWIEYNPMNADVYCHLFLQGSSQLDLLPWTLTFQNRVTDLSDVIVCLEENVWFFFKNQLIQLKIQEECRSLKIYLSRLKK